MLISPFVVMFKNKPLSRQSTNEWEMLTVTKLRKLNKRRTDIVKMDAFPDHDGADIFLRLTAL